VWLGRGGRAGSPTHRLSYAHQVCERALFAQLSACAKGRPGRGARSNRSSWEPNDSSWRALATSQACRVTSRSGAWANRAQRRELGPTREGCSARGKALGQRVQAERARCVSAVGPSWWHLTPAAEGPAGVQRNCRIGLLLEDQGGGEGAASLANPHGTVLCIPHSPATALWPNGSIVGGLRAGNSQQAPVRVLSHIGLGRATINTRPAAPCASPRVPLAETGAETGFAPEPSTRRRERRVCLACGGLCVSGPAQETRVAVAQVAWPVHTGLTGCQPSMRSGLRLPVTFLADLEGRGAQCRWRVTSGRKNTTAQLAW